MTKFREENLDLIPKNKKSTLKFIMKLIAILVTLGIGWFIFTVITMLHVGVGG